MIQEILDGMLHANFSFAILVFSILQFIVMCIALKKK